jgi:hypothetical protein
LTRHPDPEFDLSFEDSLKIDGSYKSLGVAVVCYDGITLANCNLVLQEALNMRILILRTKPSEATWVDAMAAEKRYHESLNFVTSSIRSGAHPNQVLFEELRTRFKEELCDWRGWYMEASEHYADPHPKRDLRIEAWVEAHLNGMVGERLWLRKGCVKYKLKKDEVAKPTKPGRAIGDFGVAASLQGFCLTGRLKNAMADDDIIIGDARYRFVKKPDFETLNDTFEKLRDPPEKHFFVYFSDDSCYARRLPDGTVASYNVDISKCDASHTEETFDLLTSLLPKHAQDDCQLLTDQCKADIEVALPEVFGSKRKLRLSPSGARLYSGSTLTTIINNLANLLVASQLVGCKSHEPKELVAAVAQCGYCVTLDLNEIHEDTQFLKNSPVWCRDEGRYVSILNLGVLLRTSGRARGDIPGK